MKRSQPCTDGRWEATQAKEDQVQTLMKKHQRDWGISSPCKEEWGRWEREKNYTQWCWMGVGRWTGSIPQWAVSLCLWFLPSNPMSFPGGWTIIFVFWFLLFLFAAWFYPWHPCLSTLRENTWSPKPLHLVTYRIEVSREEPFIHFKSSPSSFQCHTQCASPTRIASTHILLLSGIWKVGSVAWGRHFRRGFHRNSNFPSSCSCSLSLYF